MLDIFAERIPRHLADQGRLADITGTQANHPGLVLEHFAERFAGGREVEVVTIAAVQNQRNQPGTTQATAVGRTKGFTGFDGEIDNLHGIPRGSPEV